MFLIFSLFNPVNHIFFVPALSGKPRQSSGGLSDNEKTSIIVVCVLLGVLLIVGIGVVGVVRHTKTMYKTMGAKRQSQVSLQSRLDSERAKVIVDNRRSNRRNSRSERRSIMQQRSTSFASNLVSPQEGDVMFVSASSTRADLDAEFTDKSSPSLPDQQDSPYAPIGPGEGVKPKKAPELPQRKMSVDHTVTPTEKEVSLTQDPNMKAARQVLHGSSSEDLLPTDDDKSSTASSEHIGEHQSSDSLGMDDGSPTDYEEQP